MNRLAPRVQAAQLRNGAHVYLLENHHNQTVDFVGYIDGGLFLEEEAHAGLANLCAGMLDRGTRTRDQAAIADALESNGARLGYGMTRETVTLRGRALAEDLELLLELLGETLIAPSFPEDQLRILKEDARAGLREAAFDTYTRAYRRAGEMLFGAGHPYARDTLGREACLEAVTRTDLKRFHARAVAASRLHLAVVGDIQCAAALALIERHLGALPAGDAGPIAGFTDAPPPAGEAAQRRAHVTIADKGQVDIVFMRSGIARTAPDFTAAALANFILGGSFVSRLNQQLRDTEGLTYGVQSALTSGLHPGFWSAYIGVHPTNVAAAIEGTRRELRRLAAEGVSEEELQLAREHLSGSFPIKLETNRAIAAVLLEGLRSGRGLDYIDRYSERIAAVLRAEVHAAARDLFAADDLIIVSAGPALDAQEDVARQEDDREDVD